MRLIALTGELESHGLKRANPNMLDEARTRVSDILEELNEKNKKSEEVKRRARALLKKRMITAGNIEKELNEKYQRVQDLHNQMVSDFKHEQDNMPDVLQLYVNYANYANYVNYARVILYVQGGIPLLCCCHIPLQMVH